MTQRTKEESESQSHVGGGELGKGDSRGKPPVLRSPLRALSLLTDCQEGGVFRDNGMYQG